jgi:hypothetical protein
VFGYLHLLRSIRWFYTFSLAPFLLCHLAPTSPNEDFSIDEVALIAVANRDRHDLVVV